MAVLTSNIMKKQKELVALLPTNVKHYLTDMADQITEFPAVVFNPANQTPEVNLANWMNRLLTYSYNCIVVVRIKDYETFEQAVDHAWYLYETIPNLLKCKMMPCEPFGDYIANKEVYAIRLLLVKNI